MRIRLLCALLTVLLSETSSAQWPALYFRPDPFLRLDLSRPQGGSAFGMAAFNYTADSYFDGRDQTPHTSKADAPIVRFQREEYTFSSVFGLSGRTAAVVVVPVSYVSQRLFESGEWGVERVWGGLTYALDRSHHFSVLFAAAVPIDDQVGRLHFPVVAGENSGFVTSQIIVSRRQSGYVPELYLRAGVGVYTSKEEYYGRRLYEIPGELRVTMPVSSQLRVGVGSEGRFVVGAPDDRYFVNTLSSHDAFAFGPEVGITLTPDARLHAIYRHEVFGFFATAGSYWSIAMVIAPQRP